MMIELRINSWNELQEAIFAESWRPQLRRHRSPFAFRGMADANHRLDTSLSRLGGDYAEMERHLLRNFQKYACRVEVESDTIWSWLSLAKHHHLPTRLLDWSFSPFVAMHFMTANQDDFENDGAIWVVNYIEAHRHIPEVLRTVLGKEGSDVFTVDMLASVAESLQEFDSLAREPFALFFEPPSIDERIVNQFALFSILSNSRTGLDGWLAAHPDLARKISVPARLKWEIRDKLDQANITERVLFPGLDGLSSWLKRQYTSRE